MKKRLNVVCAHDFFVDALRVSQYFSVRERERERERKMVSLLQLISFKMYREDQPAWSTHSQVAPMRIDLKHWDSQLLNIDV